MRIRIRISFVLYMVSIALFSSWYRCIAVFLALFVHECGHLITSKIIGEQIDTLELTPFGGIMTYMPGTTPSKGLRGLAVSVSGPMANYLLLSIVSIRPAKDLLVASLIRELILSNFSMILMNMLPILPLDGGQILFCIGYYVFPVSGMISVLTYAGTCVGISVIILAVYVYTQTSMLNLSFLLIGFYLFFSSRRCRDAMLAEHAYLVIQESKTKPTLLSRIQFYQIILDTPLLSLLKFIARPPVAFWVSDIQPQLILDDTQVRQMILKNPTGTIRDALHDANPCFFDEKSHFSP